MDLGSFLERDQHGRPAHLPVLHRRSSCSGFAQGTIRRLIGIASILFSFLFAANIAEPLGDYLGSNWTQFSKEYSTMIGFGTVFVASAIAFALVAQGLYKPQPLFQKARFARRDHRRHPRPRRGRAHPRRRARSSSTRSSAIPGIAPTRRSCRSCATSGTRSIGSKAAGIFRDTLIPAFFALTGFLVPDWIESAY